MHLDYCTCMFQKHSTGKSRNITLCTLHIHLRSSFCGCFCLGTRREMLFCTKAILMKPSLPHPEQLSPKLPLWCVSKRSLADSIIGTDRNTMVTQPKGKPCRKIWKLPLKAVHRPPCQHPGLCTLVLSSACICLSIVQKQHSTPLQALFVTSQSATKSVK